MQPGQKLFELRNIAFAASVHVRQPILGSEFHPLNNVGELTIANS